MYRPKSTTGRTACQASRTAKTRAKRVQPIGLIRARQARPANDNAARTLDIGQVWRAVSFLATAEPRILAERLRASRLARLLSQKDIRCAGCRAPVLEHTYDAHFETVRSYGTACAIAKPLVLGGE